MNLRNIGSRIDKLMEVIQTHSTTSYHTFRDEEANLHIVFENGMKFRLPVFGFRPYQIEAQKKLFIELCKRFFFVRPRRSGKEVESWNLIISSAIEKSGLYFMIYPTNVRARIVLWEGAITLDDGSSLKFLDMIPKPLVAPCSNPPPFLLHFAKEKQP